MVTSSPIVRSAPVVAIMATLRNLQRGKAIEKITRVPWIWKNVMQVHAVDATTCGGVGPAIDVIGAATLRGAAVLPHVFGQLHAQLAGAYSGIEAVEYIPETTGADPLSLILRRNLKIANGMLSIDEEPGAGIELDWAGVERFQVNSFEAGN